MTKSPTQPWVLWITIWPAWHHHSKAAVEAHLPWWLPTLLSLLKKHIQQEENHAWYWKPTQTPQRNGCPRSWKRSYTCLLVMSETTSIMSHQNDCLNVSWTRGVLGNLPKCQGAKTTRPQYYTKITGHYIMLRVGDCPQIHKVQLCGRYLKRDIAKASKADTPIIYSIIA